MKIKKFVTLCITNMAVAGHGVNLLHIISGETSHYVLVKDLSRLVSRQYNNHNNKKIFPSILFKDFDDDDSQESCLLKTLLKSA